MAMKTPEAIRAEITALETLLKAAETAANEKAVKAYAALVPVYDWKVEWKNEYEVAVEKRLTDACIAEREALKVKYPDYSPSTFVDLTKWQGMTYTITRGDFIVGGGGTVVLVAGGWGRKRKLSPAELKALLASEVPESLIYDSRNPDHRRY